MADAAAGADFADGSVHVLTNGSVELRTILDSTSRRGQLVIADFSASWCGPCRAMEPVLHRMAQEHRGRVAFVKVDCEATSANQQLAREVGITAFPTFHVYRAGQRVGEVRGANPRGLQDAIAQQLPLMAPAGAPQQGAAGAAAGPPGPMATALAQALSTMRSSCSYDDFLAAARTLLTYVSNALAHPEEPKYRRIRMSNAAFQSKIYSKAGGKEAMAALGFEPRHEKGGEGEEDAGQQGDSEPTVLVMDTIPPELPQVKALLEQAIPGSSAAAHPQPGPAAPASGAPGAGATQGAGAGASNVDANALARALAAAMSSAAAGGRGAQPGAAGAGTSAGGAGAAGPGAQPPTRPAGAGRGAVGRPRMLRLTVPMLARMLEKVLTDSGIGAPPPS